jgi:hypothetical protein
LGETTTGNVGLEERRDALMNKPAAARDFVFGTSQHDFRHRPPGTAREMGVERSRRCLAEVQPWRANNGAGSFVGDGQPARQQ